ncbi:hypothetical protein MJO55_08830 [Mycolicibacterium rufum]|uniref:Transmembrane protein n=1 Tax=Mycolicibacterium rufum TaxID=318424 RepID=A0A9X2YB69_9MYCO|nr:hypothetical protein [Mycolicibacterium rufum]KGI67544.1 membrane protein [Mycolicibacterium rufum]MCV7070018.1 hypothetical protein [Mycolicibacterium rufum]ULP38507.1 hypothetical protein MJO55_08830 [Mycolicibacterium rufum]
MHAGSAVAAAATFVWLGMVLAISFLEAPLKFRAPGVTLPLGLGIGRLVFRALNACEAVLAVVVIAGLLVGRAGAGVAVAAGVAVVTLAVQVLLVRPALTRRSDQVLAGADGPRSHAHLVYVGLEVAKVVALVVTGVLLFAG